MSMLDYFSQINYCLFSNSSKTATSTFGVAETIMLSVFLSSLLNLLLQVIYL